MNFLQEAANLLTGENLTKISQSLNTDEESVSKGITAAIPAILTALNTKAQQSDIAPLLLDAVRNNFGGELLDNLGDYFNHPQNTLTETPKILSTIFGDSEAKAQEKVVKASGLAPSLVVQLMSSIAPVVLSLIGKYVKEQNLDSSGFTSLLNDQMSIVRSNAPGLIGFLERIDANDDGSIADDLGRLFNNLFGKKEA
jgi:hypothetical protein